MPCTSIPTFASLNQTLVSQNRYDYVGGIPEIWIGAQKWQAVNVIDSFNIQVITDNTSWAAATGAACCYYANTTLTTLPICTRGLLFNWYGAKEINDQLIATNSIYRVGSSADYNELQTYLTSQSKNGCDLKSTSTTGYWNSPSCNNNSTGFSGIGAGFRLDGSGAFQFAGTDLYIWCSDEVTGTETANRRGLQTSQSTIGSTPQKKTSGLSVRLLIPSVQVNLTISGAIAGESVTFGGYYSDTTISKTVTANDNLKLRNGLPVNFTVTTGPGRIAAFTALSGLTVNNNNSSNASATYTNNNNGLTAPITVQVTFSSSIPVYTVTWNANGGSVTPTSSSVNQGSSVTAPTPTLAGHTFNGWFVAISGGSVVVAGGGSYTPTNNITLYAQWTANTYTVTYNANQGTGAPSNQTKTYAIPLTLSSTTPTRPGYTFTGWNTQQNGSGTTYQPGATYTQNAAVTLYAQWTNSTPSLTLTCNNFTSSVDLNNIILGTTFNPNNDYISIPYTNLTNLPFNPAPAAGPFFGVGFQANVVPGNGVTEQGPLTTASGTIKFQLSGTVNQSGSNTLILTYGGSTCSIPYTVTQPAPAGLILENNINLERGGYLELNKPVILSPVGADYCFPVRFRVTNTGGPTQLLYYLGISIGNPALIGGTLSGTFTVTHSDGTVVFNTNSLNLNYDGIITGYDNPFSIQKVLDTNDYFEFEFTTDFEITGTNINPVQVLESLSFAFSDEFSTNLYYVTYPLDPTVPDGTFALKRGLTGNPIGDGWVSAIQNQLGGPGAVISFGTVMVGDTVSVDLPIYNLTINSFTYTFAAAPFPNNALAAGDFSYEIYDENNNLLASGDYTQLLSFPEISPLGDTNIYWTFRFIWTPSYAYSITGVKADLNAISCNELEYSVYQTAFSGNSTSESGGTITELQCNNSTVNGGPLADGISVPAGTTFTIGYTGGDGGVYSTQTISSSSVTGIMATLQSGTFSVGSGTLTYNLSGVPNGNGEASFLITFNGPNNTIVSCTVVIDVTPVIDLDYFGCGSPQYPNGAPSFTTNTNQTVEINIPYSAQQGGEYAGATINSTGVTGLQLELFPMSITSGSSGVFVGNISGVASTPGNAVFNICVGGYNGIGQDCCNLIIPISSQPTTIQSLDCDNAIVTGTLLYPGTYAASSNITISLNYTGSNGGVYPTTNIPSVGVEGLFASIAQGTLNGSEANLGSGTLVYTIIGTPSGVGTASFNISIGGQQCLITTEVTGTEGTVSSLNCAAATTNTTLISGASVNGIVLSVPYTGGNGGVYTGQTLTSNFPNLGAVTGTLAPGTLAVGNGSLSITLSGTMPAGFVPITFDFEFPEGSEPCLITLTPEVDAGTAEVDCNNLNVVGAITYPTPIPVNQPVQLWLNYSNSNGGSYGPATFISQPPGVGGLTATLPEGQFSLNDGFVQLYVTGTPQSSGNAIFVVNIGGTECTLTVPVGAPEGTISTFNCASAVFSGPIVNGSNTTGTTLTIPYYGSNGGSYLGDIAQSNTIVSGITATLAPGVFNQPSGSVVYNLSGTPAGTGSGQFNLTLGNLTCLCQFTVVPANGQISALNCNAASFSGSFTQGFFSTVNGTIPYTGGNGGTYASTSNSQNGLTLTVPSGTFNNGSGNIPFTITGTPVNSGDTTFSITVGGVTCNNLTITVQSAIPIINDLRCSETVVTGTLSVGQPSTVSFTLYYYGSNQQPYPQNTSNSTGVTGLTATTPSGTLIDPTGTLVYTVTGTPQTTGTATFLIIIGSKSCTVTIPVTQPNYFGPESPSPCQEVTYTDPGCEVLSNTCTILVDGSQVNYTVTSNVDPCQVTFQIPCTTEPGSSVITFEDCNGDVIIEEPIEISDSTDDSYFTPPDGVPPGEEIVYVDPDCSTVPNVDNITFNGDPVTYVITSTTPPCTILITIPPNATPGDGTFEFTDDNGDVIFEGTYPVLDPPVDDNTFDPPGGALPGDEVTFTNPGCDIVTGELDQILVNGVPATITGTTPAPECSVTFDIPTGIDCGNSTIEFVDNLGNVIGSQEYPIGCEGNDDGTYTVTFTPQDEGCHLIYFKTTGEDYCVYQADGPFEVGVPVTITINLIDYADCLGTVPPVACVDPLRVTGFIRPCCTQDGSKDVDLNFVEYQTTGCKMYSIECESVNCGTFTRSNCTPSGCYGYVDPTEYSFKGAGAGIPNDKVYMCSGGEGIQNTTNSTYFIKEIESGETVTLLGPELINLYPFNNSTWITTGSLNWDPLGLCPYVNPHVYSLENSQGGSVLKNGILSVGKNYVFEFYLYTSNFPITITAVSGASTLNIPSPGGFFPSTPTTFNITAGANGISFVIPSVPKGACFQLLSLREAINVKLSCCNCLRATLITNAVAPITFYYTRCGQTGPIIETINIQSGVVTTSITCIVYGSLFPVNKSDVQYIQSISYDQLNNTPCP